MKKRAQNVVAESRLTLPTVLTYSILLWLTAGLVAEQWWIQFVCFAVSTYLMAELNNSYALIRIYSRMVSASFLVLLCMTGLFSSTAGAIAQLCVVASYLTVFHCYQDKTATGWTFYTFVLIGLASLVQVHILYFVPFLWLLMLFNLQCMSWRTFFASIIGLLTPYWFGACYFVYQGDFMLLGEHFASLAVFQYPYDYASLDVRQVLTFAFVVAICLTGIIHYVRNSYNDKIRTRQFYGCFITMSLLVIVLLVVQPQHYDLLMRLLIINTSPLIAHFLSLTYTRITNVAFFVIVVVALALTIVNTWMPSLTF